jgi:flagellar basal body rod protein FlgB
MQLDEIARNLVSIFAEGDDGLLVWSDPAGPKNAGTIRVSSSYVTSEGGSPTKLRDGVNGQFNPGGAAGFSDRLRALNEAFSEPMAFDPAAGLAANSSLIDYSASSISWLEGKRQKANSEFSYNATVATQADAALSNANGVDMDTEMALLLDLEHSYQASSRVLSRSAQCSTIFSTRCEANESAIDFHLRRNVSPPGTGREEQGRDVESPAGSDHGNRVRCRAVARLEIRADRVLAQGI